MSTDENKEDSNVFCMKCGKELDDLARFCPNCGAMVRGAEQSKEENKQVSTINLSKESDKQESVVELGKEAHQEQGAVELNKTNYEAEGVVELNKTNYEQVGVVNLSKEVDKQQSVVELSDESCEEMIGRNKVSTLRVMIGGNIDHYIKIFKKIEDGEDPGPTGLAFIAPCWFLYRKMYVHFFVLVGIQFILMCNPILSILVNIGITVYLLINMRKMYYRFVLDKLEKSNLTGKDVNDDEKYLRIIRSIGQTSYVGVSIYLIIMMFFVNIINFIIGMYMGLMEEYEGSSLYDTYSEYNYDNQYEYAYGDIYEDDMSLQESNIVEKVYKKSCNKVTYEELVENPDLYNELPVLLTGKVIQIVYDGDNTLYRICITRDGSEWKNPIVAEYALEYELEYQTDFCVLEGDIVTLWGDSAGLISYESKDGSTITVPGITVMYMDLIQEG